MIPRDRPPPADGEIEITPEMIEAGVATFYDWDSRIEEPSGLVRQIFQAMAAASIEAPQIRPSSLAGEQLTPCERGDEFDEHEAT